MGYVKGGEANRILAISGGYKDSVGSLGGHNLGSWHYLGRLEVS